MRCLIRLVSVLLGQLQRHKAVVLGDQCAGTGLEVLAILVGPPVVELAVAVVLRTLIVEAMADLVADHCADAAIIRRILGLRVEERGLQNRGREHDDVHARLVVGVHRLRIHQPFVLVDRLADLGQLIAGLVQVRGLGVLGGQRIRGNTQRRIIAPVVGVADLRRELGDLLQSLGLGVLAQPIGIGDGHAVGVNQIGDQLFHAALRAFGEVQAHVFAAHIFTTNAVDQAHRALPTIALLLGTGEHLAVEVKVGGVEVARQGGGEAQNHVNTGPQLKVGQIGLGPERIKTSEEARLVHNDAREHRLEINRLSLGGFGGVISGLPSVDPRTEIEVFQRGGQIGVIGGVVGLHRVARGHIVPMVGGDLGFHGKEVAGHAERGFAGNRGGSIALVIAGVGRQFIATVGFGGGRVPGVHQLGGDHRHVCFAHGDVVVLTIVGFVRQAKAGLLKVGDIAVRVAGVAVNGQAEQVGAAGWVDRAEHARECGLVDGGIDEVKLIADRVKAGGLYGVGVEE